MAGLFQKIFGHNDHTELQEAVQNAPFLVDVRTPAEFASGSVKGAVIFPLIRYGINCPDSKDARTSLSFAGAVDEAVRRRVFWNKAVFTLS